MINCLHMTYDDECELFYDLDDDEVNDLLCDGEGNCLFNKDCPYYVSPWEWKYEED